MKILRSLLAVILLSGLVYPQVDFNVTRAIFLGDVQVNDTLLIRDATGADTTLLYDDGTNFIIKSDNPISLPVSIIGITQLTVDNLRLDGNTLSSIDANGNIELTPNGSGLVNMAEGDFGIATVAVTGSAAELNVLDGATAGTAVASKAVVLDATKDFDFGTGDVSATLVNATTQYNFGGVQVTSGILSDLADIAMLNEAETILSNWDNTANPWAVNEGGTGLATITDGAVMLGSGTGAITPLAVVTAGAIVIGDGAVDPTTLNAFTSATGVLKHEYGGVEVNISGIADGGVVVGTGVGSMAIRASFLTSGAAGFIKHELGGLEFDLSAVADGSVPIGTGAGTMALESGATLRTSLGVGTGDAVEFAQITVDGTIWNANSLSESNVLFTLDFGTGGVRLNDFIGIDSAPDIDETLLINRAFTVGTAGGAYHVHVGGNITEMINVAHTTIAPVAIDAITVVDAVGTETVTNLASLYVAGAPTAGSTPTNGPYSIFVDAGESRFDGDIGDATNRVPVVYAVDINASDDILLADGGIVGITGNEIITFNATGTIVVSGATLQAVDVDLSGDIYLDATKKLILADDADDHTHIAESAANTILLTAGGTGMIQVEVGKVGIENTSLESWWADNTVLQIGGLGSISTKTGEAVGQSLDIANNAYLPDATAWHRMMNDEATMYRQVDGTHTFWVAGAAAPDVDIVFTNALTIDNSGYLELPVTAAITADVGSAQGNGALTTPINEISVCANAGDAVTLPTAVAGLVFYISNNGAQSADVFPAAGDAIDGGAANAAYALAAGTNKTFIAVDATNWHTF